jgi:hypothetical protein
LTPYQKKKPKLTPSLFFPHRCAIHGKKQKISGGPRKASGGLTAYSIFCSLFSQTVIISG